MSIFFSCGGVREDNLFFSRRCIIQQACWCWCVGVGGGVGVGVWVWVVVLVLVVMLFFFVDVDGVGVGACFAAVLTWVLLTSAVLILFYARSWFVDLFHQVSLLHSFRDFVRRGRGDGMVENFGQF